MRKLATIRRISAINPIPKADAIEVATVGGWKAVVKKGVHHVGELVVYLEVDSFVPQHIAPFLVKNEPKEYNGIKGEVLRTLKLRGQLSQGLILPMSGFDAYYEGAGADLFKEGDDVTSFLGIQKWEAPFNPEIAVGPWPSLVPKTDQERLQNLLDEFNSWKAGQYTWEVSEKIEGMSGQYLIDHEGEFLVLSHGANLRKDVDSAFVRASARYNIENKLKILGLTNLAIQGEVVGPGIQSNIYNLSEVDFFVYNMYDVATGEHLPPTQRKSLVTAMGLKHVPLIETNHVISPDTDIDRYIEGADGISALFNTRREGLVYKCNEDPSVTWKVISNAYLLNSDL